MSRYRFIDAEKAAYPVTLLCRVLGVVRSGYSAWQHRGVSARTQADQALTVQILSIHDQSRGTYGAPRVHAELQVRGVRCGSKRVARLMRAAGLGGRSPRRAVHTTVVDATKPPAPNLLARDFRIQAPDQVWVGDITYVPTWEGWLYLAILVDAYSRRVVGWAMADHLRTELALEALHLALTSRRPGPGLIHHTDRGCQYTATAYQQVLGAHGIAPSMSRTGNCYDNALAESFFATLKRELIDTQPWPTRRMARQAIFEWLEVFYNRQRRHSALSYVSPVTFEGGRWEEVRAA